MNWFLENLPLMVLVTVSIIAILGIGMWHEYSSKPYADIVREENESLYMPHVAQGIRREVEQKSVEPVALVDGEKRRLVRTR